MKFTAHVVATCLGMLSVSSARFLSPHGLAFVSPLAATTFPFSSRSSSTGSATPQQQPVLSQQQQQQQQQGRRFMTTTSTNQKLPILADESVMAPKAHGTSEKPVMKNLRWNCDYNTADRITNFNRHYAEYAGYWQTTDFVKEVEASNSNDPVSFYDSVTGALLFTAPVGRPMKEFLVESQKHGWPSFRDEEVNWDNVRCLSNGECVSVTGSHLGHNIPDSKGNRYCINLVSVAGQPQNKE